MQKKLDVNCQLKICGLGTGMSWCSEHGAELLDYALNDPPERSILICPGSYGWGVRVNVIYKGEIGYGPDLIPEWKDEL